MWGRCYLDGLLHAAVSSGKPAAQGVLCGLHPSQLLTHLAVILFHCLSHMYISLHTDPQKLDEPDMCW